MQVKYFAVDVQIIWMFQLEIDIENGEMCSRCEYLEIFLIFLIQIDPKYPCRISEIDFLRLFSIFLDTSIVSKKVLCNSF